MHSKYTYCHRPFQIGAYVTKKNIDNDANKMDASICVNPLVLHRTVRPPRPRIPLGTVAEGVLGPMRTRSHPSPEPNLPG